MGELPVQLAIVPRQTARLTGAHYTSVQRFTYHDVAASEKPVYSLTYLRLVYEKVRYGHALVVLAEGQRTFRVQKVPQRLIVDLGPRQVWIRHVLVTEMDSTANHNPLVSVVSLHQGTITWVGVCTPYTVLHG